MLDRTVGDYRRAGVDHGDLLSVLLASTDQESGNGMTDAQARDEAMTIMISGSETAANTLSWAAYLLSRDPDVQDRLGAEVSDVLGGRPAGHDDLPRLDYTRRVLTEALRMYPTTWLLSRRPVVDVTLGGHRIPRGSQLLFSPFALHNDATLHPDPERFDPDRWLPDRASRQPRFSFLPFGAGIRSCIGEGFAWAETIIVLSTLVSRVRLRPVPGVRVTPVIRTTLQPIGLPMYLRRRAG